MHVCVNVQYDDDCNKYDDDKVYEDYEKQEEDYAADDELMYSTIGMKPSN